jgi:hypothetical protein
MVAPAAPLTIDAISNVAGLGELDAPLIGIIRVERQSR